MAIQYNIFGEIETEVSDKQVIRNMQKKIRKKLSPIEKKYNKLVKTLQKLEVELNAFKEVVPEIKGLYFQTIQNEIPVLIEVYKKSIDKYGKFMLQKSNTKTEKIVAQQHIVGLLNEIEALGGNYDEAKDLYLKDFFLAPEGFEDALEDLFGMDVDMDADEEEDESEEDEVIFDMMEQMEQELMHMFGRHIPVSFDIEEFKLLNEKKKMEFLQDLMLEKIEENKNYFSKKEQKQFNKAVENKKKADQFKDNDFGKLYKKLAKLIHPDLEQDPKVKLVKQALMQELAETAEKEDLFGLLKINSKYETITGQKGIMENVSEEDMIPMLEYQIKELEIKIEIERRQNPDAHLLEVFHHPQKGILSEKIKLEKKKILKTIGLVKKETDSLINRTVFKKRIREILDERMEAMSQNFWEYELD